MVPKIFHDFFHAIPSRTEKENYKAVFMNETKLSYPTVYAYLNGNVKKIPHMASKKIIEIAYRLYPDLALIHFPKPESVND